MFYLAYYLHWPWSELMALDLAERRIYVEMLAGRIADENHELEALHERLLR